jgi:hypothetical protein
MSLPLKMPDLMAERLGTSIASDYRQRGIQNAT